ncbi:hypothetical protein AMTR_s00096p00082820 [Amborella trichopoda]|uniref:Uncharacterized protein n=1 Tax=Amborella trichopoda TaxID=13333 RepID=W1P3Z6_AMBTC|nr:hypothetical protein AMTR_s00096p00082820 [Amborella trichopoda]
MLHAHSILLIMVNARDDKDRVLWKPGLGMVEVPKKPTKMICLNNLHAYERGSRTKNTAGFLHKAGILITCIGVPINLHHIDDRKDWVIKEIKEGIIPKQGHKEDIPPSPPIDKKPGYNGTL